MRKWNILFYSTTDYLLNAKHIVVYWSNCSSDVVNSQHAIQYEISSLNYVTTMLQPGPQGTAAVSPSSIIGIVGCLTSPDFAFCSYNSICVKKKNG